MQEENYRRQLVQTALRLTEGTAMTASPYERQLLEQFVLVEAASEPASMPQPHALAA
jgi:hypothetical protein